MKTLLAVVMWIVCGFYTWGTFMAEMDWRNSHDWAILHKGPRDNVGPAFMLSMMGPLAIPADIFETNFNQHGWTIWALKEPK